MNVTNLASIDKSADYQKKIQASFAEKVSSIKENDQRSPEAFGGDAFVKIEISALGAEELEKVRQSWDNHPVSALHRTDILISANADGVYRIGKVDFSEKEFESARELVTGMTSQLKQGTLSYSDHTKMALAESLIDKCAANSFSDDQRQVIVRAMTDYNERLINRNNETISKSNYVRNDDESAGMYWGLKKVIPASARDEMAKLFGNSPSGTVAVTSIATNRELIESLQKKAKEIDVTTPEGFEQFKTFYRTTMSSVYDAQYPDKMKSNSGAAIELDLNGSDGMKKLVEFANRWLEGKVQ